MRRLLFALAIAGSTFILTALTTFAEPRPGCCF
jgi:hypothetical protein